MGGEQQGRGPALKQSKVWDDLHEFLSPVCRMHPPQETLPSCAYGDVLLFSWLPPGEGPDCHCPKEIDVFGPIPARIRVVIYSYFLSWP